MTLKTTKPKADVARAEAAIVKLAAAFPEVKEDHPWGHRAFKVRNKTFLFMGADAEGLGLSVKLPDSGDTALSLPFTEPTHYDLGKAGWVSATFTSGREVPMALIQEWLKESYCAIAPKKLVAALEQAAQSARTKPKAKSKAARAKSGTARPAQRRKPKQPTQSGARRRSART